MNKLKLVYESYEFLVKYNILTLYYTTNVFYFKLSINIFFNT